MLQGTFECGAVARVSAGAITPIAIWLLSKTLPIAYAYWSTRHQVFTRMEAIKILLHGLIVGLLAMTIIFVSETTAYQSRKFAMIVAICSGIPGLLMLLSNSKHMRIRAKIHAFALIPVIFFFAIWAFGIKVNEIYYILKNGKELDPTFHYPMGLGTPAFWIIAFPALICATGVLFLLLSPWCITNCICKESYFEMVCWSFLVGFTWMGIGWGFLDAAGLSYHCKQQGIPKGYMLAILSAIDLGIRFFLDQIGLDNRTLTKECLAGTCDGKREIVFGKGYCCHYSKDFRWYWIRNYPLSCYGPFPGPMQIVETEVTEPNRTIIQIL
jgi:multisubunit Na+/H+ antiporter MnhE subunit